MNAENYCKSIKLWQKELKKFITTKIININFRLDNQIKVEELVEKSPCEHWFFKKSNKAQTDLSKDYLEFYFYNTIRYIEEIILLTHKIHEYNLKNILIYDNKRAKQLIYLDFILHKFVILYLEGLVLIKEYDEIFDKNFDVLKIVFTIDFQIYNRFLMLKPFYNRKIEKIGILNFIPFEKYQKQINEINLIYLQWLSFVTLKNLILDYTQIKNSMLIMFIKHKKLTRIF